MHDRNVQIRVAVVALGLLLGLGGVGVRLGYLHLANHSRLRREFTRELLSLRGRIFDRNGGRFPMALSLPARFYFLDPQAINKKHDPERIVMTVADALNLDPQHVFGMLRQDSRYIELGVSTDDRIHELLTNRQIISGVGSQERIIRRYPQGRRMAHVLGFVNNAGLGSAGVEQQYNRYLTGTPGEIISELDASQTEIRSRRRRHVPPIPGSDVHLTLDHNIQYAVEMALREVVAKFDAESAVAIVQEVRTGAILGMGSYPDFMPERYTLESADVWRNRAIANNFEPGSVMKAITLAAAFNERLVTPDTVMDAGQGVWFYAGKPLRDHVMGRVTIATAMQRSSNVVFAKLGLMLGNRRLEGYMRGFNFGEQLGIDLPGEERGILDRAREWDRLKPTRIPIGHGIAVTGLQMVNAYSALANDGVLMRPYVVSKVVSPTGELLYQARPEIIGRPVRPEVARQARKLLDAVTEEGGTGRRANVPGYSVAGKTGTAQRVIRGGYSQTEFDATFVGFLPASQPVFTVLVSVARPRPQYTGGFVAAPVFAQIAAATARYLEVPPDLSPGEGDDDLLVFR